MAHDEGNRLIASVVLKAVGAVLAASLTMGMAVPAAFASDGGTGAVAVAASSSGLEAAKAALDQAKADLAKAEAANKEALDLQRLGAAGYFKRNGSTAAYRALTDPTVTKYLSSVKLNQNGDATTLANLKTGVRLVERVNSFRQGKGLSAVKVSDFDMAAAAADADYSKDVQDHARQFNSYENLSWIPFAIGGDAAVQSAVTLWTNEETLYRQLLTQYPQRANWSAGQWASADLANYERIGHYLNMTVPGLATSGGALNSDAAAKTGDQTFGWVADSRPASSGDPSALAGNRVMTADAYLKDIESYETWLAGATADYTKAKDALDKAQKAYDELAKPDTVKPVITGADDVTVAKGVAFDPLEDVKATDDRDGDLTAKIVVSGSVDVNTHGVYRIVYTVSDTAGNKTTVTRSVTVRADSVPTGPFAPVYRLYNPRTRLHLYTADPNERNVLASGRGWVYEGIPFHVSTNPNDTGAKPVYRLYNAASGRHLLTFDEHERAVLSTRGWKDESVAWYQVDGGATPIYRLYSPFTKEHLYTADTNEYNVNASHGWTGEGVAWLGFR